MREQRIILKYCIHRTMIGGDIFHRFAANQDIARAMKSDKGSDSGSSQDAVLKDLSATIRARLDEFDGVLEAMIRTREEAVARVRRLNGTR